MSSSAGHEPCSNFCPSCCTADMYAHAREPLICAPTPAMLKPEKQLLKVECNHFACRHCFTRERPGDRLKPPDGLRSPAPRQPPTACVHLLTEHIPWQAEPAPVVLHQALAHIHALLRRQADQRLAVAPGELAVDVPLPRGVAAQLRQPAAVVLLHAWPGAGAQCQLRTCACSRPPCHQPMQGTCSTSIFPDRSRASSAAPFTSSKHVFLMPKGSIGRCCLLGTTWILGLLQQSCFPTYCRVAFQSAQAGVCESECMYLKGANIGWPRAPENSLSTALTSRSSASALHSGAMKNCAKRSRPPRSASGLQSKW